MTNLTSVSSASALSSPLTSKLVGALLFLLVGLVVGRLVGILLKRILNNVNLDKNLRKAMGRRFSLERFASGLVSFLIYVTAFVLALNHLGITKFLLLGLSAVALLILGVSLFLALKDFLPNLFSGISLKYKENIHVGDVIKMDLLEGKVLEITFLSTKIDSKDGLLLVPNAFFQRNTYTLKGKRKKSKRK